MEFSKELNIEINDFALYLDTDRPVSRYVLLIEPDTQLDVSKTDEYSKIFNKIIRETNKEYGVVEDRGSLDKPLVLIQQRETHAL